MNIYGRVYYGKEEIRYLRRLAFREKIILWGYRWAKPLLALLIIAAVIAGICVLTKKGFHVGFNFPTFLYIAIGFFFAIFSPAFFGVIGSSVSDAIKRRKEKRK